jgi:hypothetical protein
VRVEVGGLSALATATLAFSAVAGTMADTTAEVTTPDTTAEPLEVEAPAVAALATAPETTGFSDPPSVRPGPSSPELAGIMLYAFGFTGTPGPSIVREKPGVLSVVAGAALPRSA